VFTGPISEKKSGKLLFCHAYIIPIAVRSAVVRIRRSDLMDAVRREIKFILFLNAIKQTHHSEFGSIRKMMSCFVEEII
jgi:hypothetical protein